MERQVHAQMESIIISFPRSYDDLQSLFEAFILAPKEDEDAFTYNELSTKGRSYSFYGQKIFEFTPAPIGSAAKFRIPGWMFSCIGLDSASKDNDKLYTISENEMDTPSLIRFIDLLKTEKQKIFRSLITDKFLCCNDFNRCSDNRACLHPEDRFYNGCEYRKNLEAGRIFYGKNRNVGEVKT